MNFLGPKKVLTNSRHIIPTKIVCIKKYGGGDAKSSSYEYPTVIPTDIVKPCTQ